MTTFFNFAKDAYGIINFRNTKLSTLFLVADSKKFFVACPSLLATSDPIECIPVLVPGTYLVRHQVISTRVPLLLTGTWYQVPVVWSAYRFLHPGTRYWVLLQDHSQSSIIRYRYPGARGPTRFDRSMYVMPI